MTAVDGDGAREVSGDDLAQTDHAQPQVAIFREARQCLTEEAGAAKKATVTRGKRGYPGITPDQSAQSRGLIEVFANAEPVVGNMVPEVAIGGAVVELHLHQFVDTIDRGIVPQPAEGVSNRCGRIRSSASRKQMLPGGPAQAEVASVGDAVIATVGVAKGEDTGRVRLRRSARAALLSVEPSSTMRTSRSGWPVANTDSTPASRKRAAL